MSVIGERESEILERIKNLIENNIHGTIFNAERVEKRNAIKKILPALAKAQKWVIEHQKNIHHKLVKDDYTQLSKLLDEYEKKCVQIINNQAEPDDLNGIFSEISSFISQIEAHTHIGVNDTG